MVNITFFIKFVKGEMVMSLEERVMKAEECFKSGDIDNALEMFEDLYYYECDLDSFLEEYVGIYYAKCLYAYMLNVSMINR